MSTLELPLEKSIRGISSFKGELRLGDPREYSSALCIQVERYPRTYVTRPPTASSFVLRSGTSTMQDDSAQSSATVVPDETEAETRVNTLTGIRNTRIYQVSDESSPGKKIDVQREDLAKGYEYGRTAVHISQSDENITNLETDQALEIIGFIQSDQVSVLSNLHIDLTI